MQTFPTSSRKISTESDYVVVGYHPELYSGLSNVCSFLTTRRNAFGILWRPFEDGPSGLKNFEEMKHASRARLCETCETLESSDWLKSSQVSFGTELSHFHPSNRSFASTQGPCIAFASTSANSWRQTQMPSLHQFYLRDS